MANFFFSGISSKTIFIDSMEQPLLVPESGFHLVSTFKKMIWRTFRSNKTIDRLGVRKKCKQLCLYKIKQKLSVDMHTIVG